MMQQFRTEVEAFLSQHDMKPSTFGREFLNDPGFVFRLRDGGECRPSTMEAVRSKMSAYAADGQNAA